MLSLRELQLRFVQQIFAEDENALAAEIRANGLSSGQRLGIYRNNMLVGLTKVLQNMYPAVETLVGEDFFRYAANQYIHQHPSQSGDLYNYGHLFPEFLADFAPASGLPYLPDVAKLELAREAADHAADHAPLDLARLAQVAPEQYENLKFTLHPSARLLASDYPVLRIWEISQKDFQGEQTVNLDSGGDKLLVIRHDLNTQQQRLAEGEFVLLKNLAANVDFARACELALETQADFDVSANFQQHVRHGTIVDFFC